MFLKSEKIRGQGRNQVLWRYLQDDKITYHHIITLPTLYIINIIHNILQGSFRM